MRAHMQSVFRTAACLLLWQAFMQAGEAAALLFSVDVATATSAVAAEGAARTILHGTNVLSLAASLKQHPLSRGYSTPCPFVRSKPLQSYQHAPVDDTYAGTCCRAAPGIAVCKAIRARFTGAIAGMVQTNKLLRLRGAGRAYRERKSQEVQNRRAMLKAAAKGDIRRLRQCLSQSKTPPNARV
jgi:hypothetical protein